MPAQSEVAPSGMWERRRRPNPISGRHGVSSAPCTPVSISDLKHGNPLKAIMSLKTQRPCFRLCKSLWKPLCSILKSLKRKPDSPAMVFSLPGSRAWLQLLWLNLPQKWRLLKITPGRADAGGVAHPALPSLGTRGRSFPGLPDLWGRCNFTLSRDTERQ